MRAAIFQRVERWGRMLLAGPPIQLRERSVVSSGKHGGYKREPLLQDALVGCIIPTAQSTVCMHSTFVEYTNAYK